MMTKTEKIEKKYSFNGKQMYICEEREHMKIQLYTQGATNICRHFHSTQPHSARIASCEKYYYPELQP
jgi:hypothetical protein